MDNNPPPKRSRGRPQTLIDPVRTTLEIPKELHRAVKVLSSLQGVSAQRFMLDSIRAACSSRDVLGASFLHWMKEAEKVEPEAGSALASIVQQLKKEGVVPGLDDEQLAQVKQSKKKK